MLAFLFWHRPSETASKRDYEAALVRYHEHLAGAACPGFLGSACDRVGPVPWLDRAPGYEDWYFVVSSSALDPLNDAGVAPERWDLHAEVARRMERGHGGLYAHIAGGTGIGGAASAMWLTRPRGIRYEAPLHAIVERLPGALGCWRKRLVLGPAPEFLLLSSAEAAGLEQTALPEGWKGFSVARAPVFPARDGQGRG